jgi:hypothetical protein
MSRLLVLAVFFTAYQLQLRIQRCHTPLSHVDNKICSAGRPLKRLCTLLCKDHVRIIYFARQLPESYENILR